MFLVTQFIGLYVINAYAPMLITIINPETGQAENITLIQELPYGMQPPELKTEFDFWAILPSIIIAFAIAIFLILLLSKYKWRFLIRTWFFIVISLTIAISLFAVMKNFSFIAHASLIALTIAVLLAFFKIYKPNIYVHNFTELLIYPGIAAVFVPILNIWTVLIILILISIYDMWAVWKSGIMQKMAKFHIEQLNIFPGFLITHASKKVREKIKKLKKQKKLTKKQKNKKFKVSLAILGGGDIAFSLITAGVFLRAFGLIPALLIIAGAFSGLLYLFMRGLLYLFMRSEKKKAYPAMPFITVGILIATIINFLFVI